jgi:hypothetical protein
MQIATAQTSSSLIFGSGAYSVYGDRVEQGKYKAVALSPVSMTSDYKSPESEAYSPTVSFKFSINLRDNEMPGGINHIVTIRPVNGEYTTDITFGSPLTDTVTVAPGIHLEPGTRWHIRLDMRPVLNAFKQLGYYLLSNGEKLFPADFKGVYVAGGIRPLSWDFNNLHKRSEYRLLDPDGDGIYETTLIMNTQDEVKTTDTLWKLTKNISAYPQYKSDYPLTDALYNLALEEMVKAVEPDSTFRTGKEWAGVWTRDISYSITLSMAYLQPRVARYSLMRKVKNGHIIQDTGTGGAYPASTDRMIWATAAWELYKSTGDREWLRQAYAIIRNSVEDDMHNAYDKSTGLVRGESSFLDWREQTYPKWMQPADIYQSENLGTNAVHYHANIILAEMATLLNDSRSALRYKQQAEKIRDGINRYLWMADKGYYAQYRYGRNYMSLSPRAEALGEALCVWFGIAGDEKAASVVSRTPVTGYGISCIYPQIPGIPPYHNNAVWPFVESYWALASAKAGNERSLLESMAAIYRPAALFLTNKENFVADNGDFAGTQINSSNMLWSLSGSISLIHRIIFGIEYRSDGVAFHPFVPRALAGKRSLTGYRCRGAVLDISLSGYGNRIKSFEIDGRASRPFIPYSLSGEHSISIALAGNEDNQSINKAENLTSPDVPQTTIADGDIVWQPVKNAVTYTILKNGIAVATTEGSTYRPEGKTYAEYQVIASDNKGTQSFASEPLAINAEACTRTVEAELFAPKAAAAYKNYSGTGFVETSVTRNRTITITVTAAQAGNYAVGFRYANGNGPINTENKCAIRTLKVDGKEAGAIVLPQRGANEWSNWGYTNPVSVYLSQGKHTIALDFEKWNENMNGDVNQAMIDNLILIRK